MAEAEADVTGLDVDMLPGRVLEEVAPLWVLLEVIVTEGTATRLMFDVVIWTGLAPHCTITLIDGELEAPTASVWMTVGTPSS